MLPTSDKQASKQASNMLLRSNKQGEKVGEESKRGRKKQVKEPHQQREQSEGKTPQNGGFSWELKRKGKMPSLSFPSLNLSD